MTSKVIYYEPKTGVVFKDEPRERNVYAVRDTKENRRILKQGPTVAWLEDCERKLVR